MNNKNLCFLCFLKIRNKRADISITLLVLAVIALCSYAVFIFYNSNNSVSGNFIGASFLEDINSKKQLVDFYINSGENIETAVNLAGVGYVNSEVVIEENYVKKSSWWKFWDKKEIEILKITYNYKVEVEED